MADITDNQKLGFGIRILRETKGLRLVDVAEACGVGVSYVSQVERHEKKPSKAFLDKLGPVLGVSPYLFHDLQQPITPARRELKARQLRESLDRIEESLHEIRKIITEKKAKQDKPEPAKT